MNRTPQAPAQPKEVGTRGISAGIKKHIASERKRVSDKKFHVAYKSQDLALDLIKVHDDRLANLGNGRYFACVDMKATDGKTYDIDFFLTGSAGNIKVTETSVHKINGKPLYNWKEDGAFGRKLKVSGIRSSPYPGSHPRGSASTSLRVRYGSASTARAATDLTLALLTCSEQE